MVSSFDLFKLLNRLKFQVKGGRVVCMSMLSTSMR